MECLCEARLLQEAEHDAANATHEKNTHEKNGKQCFNNTVMQMQYFDGTHDLASIHSRSPGNGTSVIGSYA